jgi:site-specific recombinase XerD
LTKKKILANDASRPRTWEEAIAAFEEDLFRRGRAESTIVTYRSALSVFATFYREKLGKPGPYPSRLQETDLQAFVDHLRRDRLLTSLSLNRFVSALRCFARFLLEQRLSRRNLGLELRTFRNPRPADPVRLSAEEVRRIVTAVDFGGRNGPRDLAIVQLLLQGGLRVGEVASLVVDDLVLRKSGGRLRVRAAKGRADRVVPLNATARSALQAYLDTRGPLSGSEPLFASERRRRISVATVKHLVKKYLRAAGRPDLSAHALRHHFGTSLYARSGKLTVVQEVLGHRNIATTARYARATEAEIEQAVEALPDNVYPGQTRDPQPEEPARDE